MDGIAAGHPVSVIGAAVIRLQMTVKGGCTGPEIMIRGKIYKRD